MRSALLAAVAVGALLLPGCLGGGPVTARGALDAALKEAHGWDTNARLLSVSGAEMANAKGYLQALRTLGADDRELEDGTAQLLPDDDGDVGNGRLPAWGFTFGHDAPGTFRVVVGAGGKATFSKEYPGSASKLPNLASDPRWNVDSDHALDVLAGNETLARIHASSTGVLTYVLNAAPLGATLRWEVEGGERGILNQTLRVRVNADNGSLLPLRTPRIRLPDAEPKLPPIEAGQVAGNAMTQQPVTATLTMGEHATVHFLLRIPGNTFPGNLRATVESPSGDTETLQASAFLPGGGEDEATFERVNAGAWKATFSVPVGVSEEFTLYWCTDGSGAAPDNPAC